MEDFNDAANSGGALLYRYENYKQADNTKAHLKKALRTPSGIYIVALCAFITFWFFYSLIAGLCGNAPAAFIILFLPSIIFYIGTMLIMAVTVFGLWGKFLNFALRRNLVKPQDRASLESQAEALEEQENSSNKERALYVYEDKVQVYAYGRLSELGMGEIRRVEIKKGRKSFDVWFWGTFGIKPFSDLPSSELENFKSVFGEKAEISEKAKEKTKEKREKKSVKESYDEEPFVMTGNKIGGFIMGLVAVGAGVAVICLHFYVQEAVPWFLGAFFVLGGVIVMVSTLSGIPIVNKFIIPLLFGVFFTVAPTGIAIIVTDARGEKLPVNSFAEFLEGFSPLTMVAVLLGAIGLMLIVIAVVQLVKYIKGED